MRALRRRWPPPTRTRPGPNAKCIMGAKSKAAEVLAEVAKVLAATDPDEAEHVARSIVNHRWQTKALTEVAKVLAATEPDRAERLPYAVTDEVWRPQALAIIAVVLAGYHPVGPKTSLTEVIGGMPPSASTLHHPA